MIEIIASLFLVITYFISYLFSSGENKQKAKEELKEIINGNNGKMLVGFFGAALITGIVIVVFYL
ncbi:hypothetical protein ACS2MN_25340 [Bacillus cereus group sp. BceL062]|uniref:hypothetical protein n=1 Tax=Bacillus cereus group TaxID=86661 RepID=UPI0018DBDC4F|nr:hypothetical protein G9298_30905 [Bacillus thuringiensis]